ncbi:S-type pyocin domain-containing protein [Serratia rubidaea]|uniref:S-type pyocin domain-containing protein n=1 Tax=Serratia rubidaea TaxID=61652 RepID=UPI00242BE4EF|nr:S-type pyocin domain-containing protein [Serratia rubidaea]MCR0999246.1 S-type pyocin domain-containing protein [Serratia rubidaea]
MSGNGGDNAHNNQFGGGGRGPTGGVNGGPTGIGGSGGGGNWGWKYNPGTDANYIDSNGVPHIVINGGWERVPSVSSGNGGDSNAPTGGGGTPGQPSNKPAFGPDGKFMADVDGYAYQITINSEGKTSSLKRVGEPAPTDDEKISLFRQGLYQLQTPAEMLPYLKAERDKGEALRQDKAKQQVEQAWRNLPENSKSLNVNVDNYGYKVSVDTFGKIASIERTGQPPVTDEEALMLFKKGIRPPTRQEMLPYVQDERNKSEAGRQARAKQQAEQQWQNLPGNVRNFDMKVDSYSYKVTLSDMGEVKSVTRTAQPPTTAEERLSLFKQGHWHPTEEQALNLLQPERNKGEPTRQERAKQQAVAQFMSSPVNQARIKRAEEIRQQEENIRKQQEAENQRLEAEKKKAEEERKKLEAERKAAESKLQSTAVMAVRGFPAADKVSLAPVRYSVAGTGSITLDEPMANQTRSAIKNVLSELSRLATLNPAGPIGLAISLLFHSKYVGEGSASVPENIFSVTMPADTLSLPDETTLRTAANQGKTVNMSVRGILTIHNGAIVTQLVRTTTPTAVRVVNAVRDPATGYYGFTTPQEAGVPSRTILTSPADAPGAIGPTILTGPVPLPEVVTHTGGVVQTVNTPTTTTFPAPEKIGFRDTIIVFPAESGLKPLYAVYNKPYGETNAKGQYSGRNYNKDKAGGPIQNLDWKSAKIDRAGIDKVKLHTGRFETSPANEVMLDRLDKILKGELAVTDTDKRFYTHEIRELERYRNLGIKDGQLPENTAEVWNNTHTATLEDYKVNEKSHPLYTDDAIKASE